MPEGRHRVCPCHHPRTVTVLKKALSFVLAACLTLSFAALAVPASAAGFADVPVGAWYAADVQAVTSLGLFQGTSATAFSPNASMTRGMFVTALGRYAGVDPKAAACVGTVTGDGVNVREAPNTGAKVAVVLMRGSAVDVLGLENGWYQVRVGDKQGYIRADLLSARYAKFADVDYGAYYGPYVQWAFSIGIVHGISDDRFDPAGNITRGQSLSILSAYAKANCPNLPEDLTNLLFTDANNLNLGDTTTRAQAAALLHRFITAAGSPAPSPSPSPTPDTSAYTGYGLFGNVVPKSAAVSDSYFDDACFIGHSIVNGMKLYFSLPNADYYSSDGVSAGGILAYDQFPGTLADILSKRSYGKVYIMLGINEIGPGDAKANNFYNNICAVVDLIEAKQPSAVIYLISILPVSKSRSDSSENFTRDNVIAFNAKQMQASLDKNVYYLDAFGAVADANGYFPASDCAADGIHPVKAEYAVLKDYLKTHTM